MNTDVFWYEYNNKMFILSAFVTYSFFTTSYCYCLFKHGCMVQCINLDATTVAAHSAVTCYLAKQSKILKSAKYPQFFFLNTQKKNLRVDNQKIG